MAPRTKNNQVTKVTDIIDMLNHVMDDLIIHRKFSFNFSSYLESEQITKNDIHEFNNSYFVNVIQDQINEFETFLNGGDSFIREAYHGYSKPEVRKMKQYLESLISIGIEYEKSKSIRKYKKRKKSTK